MPDRADYRQWRTAYYTVAPKLDFSLGSYHFWAVDSDGVCTHHIVPVEIFNQMYADMHRLKRAGAEVIQFPGG